MKTPTDELKKKLPKKKKNTHRQAEDVDHPAHEDYATMGNVKE